MIGPWNVDRVVAPYIVEVANGPVLASVDQALRAKGTVVVPDVLANAGGVTVSYFEWVQNRGGHPWSLEVVRERLEEVLVRAFERVWAKGEERGLSLRAGAYAIALDRIGEAVEAAGTSAYFRGG